MDIKSKYNSKEKIIKYAKNLLINLSDKEIEILIMELNEVIDGLSHFYNVNANDLEPTNYIFDNINSFRKDEVLKTNSSKEIFNSFKNWNGKYIKV